MPALLQEAYTGKSPVAFVSWSGGVGAPHVPIPLRGGGKLLNDKLLPAFSDSKFKIHPNIIKRRLNFPNKVYAEKVLHRKNEGWGDNGAGLNQYQPINTPNTTKAKQAQQALKAAETWENNESTQPIEPNGTVGGARKQRRRPTRKAHRKAHRKTRRLQRKQKRSSRK